MSFAKNGRSEMAGQKLLAEGRSWKILESWNCPEAAPPRTWNHWIEIHETKCRTRTPGSLP